MKITALVDEMADVALLRKEIQQTTFLVEIALDPRVIRLGCIRILSWLRAQAVALKIKPMKLQQNSTLDQACALLIENDASCLGNLFQIQDGCLRFSDSISLNEAYGLILHAKETYVPQVIE
jgi:hypothetical protein